MNKGCYITITFKEWANWIEYSLLRADLNRVKIYNGTPTSMQNVFSAAPDITFIEDNEFVVASLANDYPRHINLPENSVSCYLSIDSVEHFYAVSERGAQLLAHTAINLKTNLSTDIEIAQGWDAFCRQQQAVTNREKSIKFCKIIDLGLTDKKIQLIDINDTNNFVKYLGIFRSFNNKPEYLERFSGTKAYGGMATRFLVTELKSKISTSVIEKLETFSTEISYKIFYKDLIKLQTRDDLTQCFLNMNNIALIKEKVGSEAIIENNNKNIEPIPLLALSLYLHYEMLLNSQIEINLSSLKFDLEILKHCYAKQSQETHITVAYLLGELYPDIMINSLYAAKTNTPSVMNMEYLESLKPKLPILDQEKFDALTKNLKFIIETPQDETVTTSDTAAESATSTEDNSSDREKSKEGDSISSAVEKNISEDESKKKNEAKDKDIDSSHPDLFGQSNELDSTESVKQHHSQLNLSEKDTALLAIKAALNNETVAKEKTWNALRKELIQKECKVFISLKNVESFRSELRRLGLEENFAKKNLSVIFVDYKKLIESLCDKIANKEEA